MDINDPDDRKVKLLHLAHGLSDIIDAQGPNAGYVYLQKQLIPRYKLTETEQFRVIFRAGVLCETKANRNETC